MGPIKSIDQILFDDDGPINRQLFTQLFIMVPKGPFLATASCYTPVHFLKYVNVNLLF